MSRPRWIALRQSTGGERGRQQECGDESSHVTPV
jgi:hypothetical protein